MLDFKLISADGTLTSPLPLGKGFRRNTKTGHQQVYVTFIRTAFTILSSKMR